MKETPRKMQKTCDGLMINGDHTRNYRGNTLKLIASNRGGNMSGQTLKGLSLVYDKSLRPQSGL